MEILGAIINVVSLFGVIFLVWDKLRAKKLNCLLDGKKIVVPSDEVKEAFRRSALAKASEIAGGRRVEFEAVSWEKNCLKLVTKK